MPRAAPSSSRKRFLLSSFTRRIDARFSADSLRGANKGRYHGSLARGSSRLSISPDAAAAHRMFTRGPPTCTIDGPRAGAKGSRSHSSYLRFWNHRRRFKAHPGSGRTPREAVATSVSAFRARSDRAWEGKSAPATTVRRAVMVFVMSLRNLQMQSTPFQ